MNTHVQTRRHGKAIGALLLTILIGAIAVTWAYGTFTGATQAAESARFVAGIAGLCAVAAASAVWTLTARLVGGAEPQD